MHGASVVLSLLSSTSRTSFLCSLPFKVTYVSRYITAFNITELNTLYHVLTTILHDLHDLQKQYKNITTSWKLSKNQRGYKPFVYKSGLCKFIYSYYVFKANSIIIIHHTNLYGVALNDGRRHEFLALIVKPLIRTKPKIMAASTSWGKLRRCARHILCTMYTVPARTH